MTDHHPVKTRFGVVAIGRNEGMRLHTCLTSVLVAADLVVYVDSGSTDGSVEMALSLGAQVIELEMSIPFTAARARNEGWKRLREVDAGLDYVQFVDGDCEVVTGWLEAAARFLDKNQDVAVVCGRRRERFPERSIYNMLCDIEWDTPVGKARACGGDAMMRIKALREVNGYCNELIAGEEPELCVRLRASGWSVWRLEEEMTMHDAAMTRFGQWWNRTKRAGYAFAEGSWLHGAPPELHYVPQARRALIWGIILPVFIAALTLLNPLFLGMLLIYPLQVLRIAVTGSIKGSKAWWRAVFLVLGRFPEGYGQLSFFFNKVFGKSGILIEYK